MWDWSLFNNGLLSNEFVLSVRDGSGWAEILLPVSRCCDSKELEINLGYNNFFCGPQPTTHINQISSFHASAFAPSASFPFPHRRLRLDAFYAGMPPAPYVALTSVDTPLSSFIFFSFLLAIFFKCDCFM